MTADVAALVPQWSRSAVDQTLRALERSGVVVCERGPGGARTAVRLVEHPDDEVGVGFAVADRDAPLRDQVLTLLDRFGDVVDLDGHATGRLSRLLGNPVTLPALLTQLETEGKVVSDRKGPWRTRIGLARGEETYPKFTEVQWAVMEVILDAGGRIEVETGSATSVVADQLPQYKASTVMSVVARLETAGLLSSATVPSGRRRLALWVDVPQVLAIRRAQVAAELDAAADKLAALEVRFEAAGLVVPQLPGGARAGRVDGDPKVGQVPPRRRGVEVPPPEVFADVAAHLRRRPNRP